MFKQGEPHVLPPSPPVQTCSQCCFCVGGSFGPYTFGNPSPQLRRNLSLNRVLTLGVILQ